MIYSYLGVPFDNLPKAPRIASGNYVGTGVYTETYYTELNIGFNPKFVFVASAKGQSYVANPNNYTFLGRFIWTEGVTQATMYVYNGTTTIYCSAENGVFKFRQYAANATANTTVNGINGNGVEYCWVAFG